MYTIIGGRGFIGSNITKKLSENNINFIVPQKNDRTIFGSMIGKVIYCAGLTSDFRQKPYDTVKAHVSYLSEVLKNTSFESLVYISSTRVYNKSNFSTEEVNLSVNPNNSDDIFNISKLMGESLCLNSGKKNVKIVRLSNVCGDDFSSNNFVYSIIKDAVDKNEIILNTTLESEKDYINIDDAIDGILKIAHYGKKKIYNVACGQNMSNEEIINIIKEITKCNVKVPENAKVIKFPIIDISKMKEEFNFTPLKPENLIKNLVINYKKRKEL